MTEADAWKLTAEQASRNSDFYYGLLRQCAGYLGPEVRRQDDGGMIEEDDFLALRVPELVGRLASRIESLERENARLRNRGVLWIP